jgi:2-polyprenyl-3-methyl-5-hydroxy-6-metoxy-1,4-benzoquinol methylase
MVQARYDAVAEFCIEGFDSIDDPASRALLDPFGPVAGLRVLDVACGHGRITRELARRGATVVGRQPVFLAARCVKLLPA